MRRWIPDRHALARSRWLKPLARYLEDDALWASNRRSVGRAVGIGLFFGFLLPIGQFLFAIAVAIVLRAHVGIAAAATLVTNPLTLGPVYWLAYRLGRWLNGAGSASAADGAQVAAADTALMQADSASSLLEAAKLAGWPLLSGLLALAVCGAIAGPMLVHLFWRRRP